MNVAKTIKFIILKNIRNLQEIQIKTKQPSLNLATAWPGQDGTETGWPLAREGHLASGLPVAGTGLVAHLTPLTGPFLKAATGTGPRCSSPGSRWERVCKAALPPPPPCPHANHTAPRNFQVSSNSTGWAGYGGFLQFEGFPAGGAGDRKQLKNTEYSLSRFQIPTAGVLVPLFILLYFTR